MASKGSPAPGRKYRAASTSENVVSRMWNPTEVFMSTPVRDEDDFVLHT